MNRENYRHHFEMLELPTSATHADIEKAYPLLRDIYAKESLAIISMQGEVSSVQTEEVLLQIEQSYLILAEMFKNEKNVVSKFVEQLVADISVFDGPTLAAIRQKLAVSLEDMAMLTRVPYKHLVNIEADNFAELPVEVYTRGFVVNYARFLALDPEIVARSYMANFRKYQNR